MELLTEFDSEVIDVDNIEEGMNESCLVGRLVSEKYWNPATLIKAITKAWKPRHGMSSGELGESKILFCFDDAMDRDWVLKNQPWHFQGYLFAIKTFTRRNEQQLSSLVNVTIEHASFWARLYGLPFSCMNERSLELHTKPIGILESVDKLDEDSVGTFIRFKVSLNITKPLLGGITIVVKGKHLWLPLKYEALPIYCLSCGTIGHDHKNCQSYNQNLIFSTLRASSSRKRKKINQDTPTVLPHDILEIILLQLPSKDLCRFKEVSTQWKAIISDPTFADTHFQLKKSSSRNLLAWYDPYGLSYSGFHVAELQKDQFIFMSKIKHPRKNQLSHGCHLKCYCDGLYLIRLPITLGKVYMLCNPSCRVEKEIRSPQRIDDSESSRTLYGIYYNPLMMDYKVVIADMKHYAVFSSRYKKWSEVKEAGGIFRNGEVSCLPGVSFSGSLYWLGKRVVAGHLREIEIICFDGKDEKFKKLTGPDCKTEWCYLNSSRGHLCLFYNTSYNEMVIMKTVKGDEKDSWMEFKVQLPSSPDRIHVQTPRPICWVSEDEIILGDIINNHGSYFMICDLREGTVVIRKNPFRLSIIPVPYLENMFLQ